MRRGLFIGGIVLLVIGALLVLAGYAIAAQPSTVTLTGGSIQELTPSGIGGGQISVSWSGGTSSTQVYLTTSQPACPNTGSNVAHGSGASGSFSASLSSGTTYGLYFCNGGTVPPSSSSIQTTTTFSGFSYLMLIGIILVIIGAIVALIGFRAQPKARAEPMPEEEAAAPEDAPYVIPGRIQADTGNTSGPTTTSSTVIGDRPPPPPPPPRYMPASEPAPPTAAGDGPMGPPRPPRVCAYCGTLNEAWITNCRKCKRPLASTGTS